jgi:hypothetical protein
LADTSTTTTTRQGYGAGKAIAIVTIPVLAAGAVFLGYELLHHVGIVAGTLPRPAPIVVAGAPPVVPPLPYGSNAAQVAGVAQSITGDVSTLVGAFSGLFGGVSEDDPTAG